MDINDKANSADVIIDSTLEAYQNELDCVFNKYRLRLVALGFTSPMARETLEREAKS